jgi:hypothetical protein
LVAHGLGIYVRFDFNLLSRVAHTIDFDEGGKKTLTSDFPCRDSWYLRRLCCCVATRPVANEWQIILDDFGSVQVSTLMAPEPQRIALTPATMSMCEFRSEVARLFGVPPAQQQLVVHGEGGDRGDAATEGSGGRDGALVGEGSDPSTTIWRSGVRPGMRLLLVATDAPVAAGEGTWSVERVVGLRRRGLESEVTRVQQRVEQVGVVAFGVGIAFGVAFGVGAATVVTAAATIVTAAAGATAATVVFTATIVGFTVGGLVGGAVGGAVGSFTVGGFTAGFTVAAAGAALEGHNYVPLPRTRVWRD